MGETDRSKKASEARAKKKYKKINKDLKNLSKNLKGEAKSTISKKSKSKDFVKDFKKEMKVKHSFKPTEGHKFFWTPEDMERYKKTGKPPKVGAKVAKKAAKKGIVKKLLGGAGWPGRLAVGALTAYDIAKALPKGKGKACRSGQYRNKKGICVNIEGVVKKDPKH